MDSISSISSSYANFLGDVPVSLRLLSFIVSLTIMITLRYTG
jgi:hypothetical protein